MASPLHRTAWFSLCVAAVWVAVSLRAAAQPAPPVTKPPPVAPPPSGKPPAGQPPDAAANDAAPPKSPADEGAAVGPAESKSETAAADTTGAEPRSATAETEVAPIDDEAERDVPDYDGRGDEPIDAGDVFIWVPRIAFAPVYLVSEYVIRWPLGKVVTAAEEHKIPALMIDFFTFGPEQKAGIVPTALVDFGLRTSVGFYFFWDDYVADGHDLRVRAATGGRNWFLVNAAHRIWLDADEEDTAVQARFEFSLRPDWVYYGLGPRSLDDNEGNYEERRLEGGIRFRSRYWRTSELAAYVAVRDMHFDDDAVCCWPDHRRVSTLSALGTYPLPPGWEDGYTTFLQQAELSLDTRKLRDTHVSEGSDFVSPPGTGVRVVARGGLHEGIRATERSSPNASDHHHWVTYGGTAAGMLDLTGHQRTIEAGVRVDFADPLFDSGEIPFTELVSLGGSTVMRGFLPGRLRGRSSTVARLQYSWPVWVWLDGQMHYSVGNVFGEHLQGFDAELLRQSFGLGIRSISARDHGFEVLLAFGTEPFRDGGAVETVRFVLGTSSGF